MAFQSVSPVILPRDHSMLTGRRSPCRKTAVSLGGGAAMTPNAAFHTVGFCAPFDLEPNCTELAVWKPAAAVVPLPRSRLKTHRRGSKAAKAGPDQCIDEFTR